MIHVSRIFDITEVNSLGELVDSLICQKWPLNKGFRLQGYLFLNDTPDWVFPWNNLSIIKIPRNGQGSFMEVDSMNMFLWTKAKALGVFSRILAGEYDHAGWVIPAPALQTTEKQG